MATKKEIKETLKELGKTEYEMDVYWNELLETNKTVQMINRCGKTWRDMHISVIRDLPTQRQRDIKAAEKKRLEEEAQAVKEQVDKEAKKHYEENFESLMIEKIDNFEDLTKRELSRLVEEYEIESARKYGSEHRWTKEVTSIVKLKDRTFMMDWQKGLTEMQENNYMEQPYEVEMQEVEVTRIEKRYIRK